MNINIINYNGVVFGRPILLWLGNTKFEWKVPTLDSLFSMFTLQYVLSLNCVRREVGTEDTPKKQYKWWIKWLCKKDFSTGVRSIQLTEKVWEWFHQLPSKQNEQALQSVCNAISQPAEGQHSVFRRSLCLTPVKKLPQKKVLFLAYLLTDPFNKIDR